MKYLFFIFTLITVSCKAQTVSLESAAQCRGTGNCPNFKFIKDFNNSLDKYVGTWKGNYNGKTYELNFTKKLEIGEDIKKDRLIGRMRIKDSGGNIIYDTFNEPDDMKTNFMGDNFQSDLKCYMIYFVGDTPKGCINYGTVYLTIKPQTPNQMSVFYWGEYDIVEGVCPSGFATTFPEKKNIFLTKQ